MIHRRILPGLLRALLAIVASVPVAVTVGEARAAPGSGVSIRVNVGYGNIYRGANWTPVRVTVHNGTGNDTSGLLTIPQSGESSSVGATPAFHGMYESPLTIPAGSTKRVTVNVPGTGIQGRVVVRFVSGGKVRASGSAYPVGVDNATLLIGALAGGPEEYAWLGRAIQSRVTTHVIPLSAAALDTTAPALAALDIIALSNVDSSQLDAAQLGALQRYVRNGGSLLLVGGPGWQRTLQPLPASLLPGRLTGQRVLPNLNGLTPLGYGTAGSTVTSVLFRPTGTVWASERGVPLVVRREVGQGAVEYLAFDPASTSLPATSAVLQHLVAMAAPDAITRTWAPGGFRARFESIFQNLALTQELANAPPATLPMLLLFALLTVLYLLVLGPANFLLLRALGRQRLALATIPALALLYLGSMGAVAAQTRDRSVTLNTVRMVTIDGKSVSRPALQYVGLAAPLPGTYRLTYDTPALPSPLPAVSLAGFSPRSASVLHATPLGMTLQEAPRTSVSFLSMKRWDVRDLTLATSVNVPGQFGSTLTPDAAGDLIGTVHNGTNLDLRDPVIVAGHAFIHLADLPAGAIRRVHIHPGENIVGGDPTSIWTTVYSSPDTGFTDDFGFFFHCCDQPPLPQETSLGAREGNAVSMFSHAHILPSPSGVVLAGWTTRPLDAPTVNGATPQRRDLTFVVAPLGIHLPARGTFQIENGVLSGRLVDIVPRAPDVCCSGFGGFGGPDDSGQISVGTGGSLTFGYTLPLTKHVHLQQFMLTPGDRSDNTGPADLYDWSARRWVTVDLSTGSARVSSPDRFVSPAGQLLVRLRATRLTGDVTVTDQTHVVDVAARGIVR